MLCGMGKYSRSNINYKAKISGVCLVIMDEICPQFTEKLTDDINMSDFELRQEYEDEEGLRLIEHSHNFPDDKDMFKKLGDRGWFVNAKYVDMLAFDIEQKKTDRGFR